MTDQCPGNPDGTHFWQTGTTKGEDWAICSNPGCLEKRYGEDVPAKALALLRREQRGNRDLTLAAVVLAAITVAIVIWLFIDSNIKPAATTWFSLLQSI